MRKRLITTAALLGAGMLLLTGTRHIVRANHEEDGKYLFVWAGDQARANPDFLAVIDFDEHSRDYGGVIATVPLPGPGATGNEPHHVTRNNLHPDPRFRLDYNTAFATGPARPHGVAFK